MAKPKGHQWVREDQDDEPIPTAERRTRDEVRAESARLEALALRLAAMTPGARAKLPLEPHVLDEIAVHGRQGPKSSRRRQLLRVQGLLRGLDLDDLEAAMGGETDAAALGRTMGRWRTRLVDGGDGELQAFLEAYPAADRGQLRALVRRARGRGDAAGKAFRRLFRLMLEAGGG